MFHRVSRQVLENNYRLGSPEKGVTLKTWVKTKKSSEIRRERFVEGFYSPRLSLRTHEHKSSGRRESPCEALVRAAPLLLEPRSLTLSEAAVEARLLLHLFGSRNF